MLSIGFQFVFKGDSLFYVKGDSLECVKGD